MSLKRDKSVEFSSDILTHLLLVLFINVFHRGIVIWFFLSAKAFKGRYFCREAIFFPAKLSSYWAFEGQCVAKQSSFDTGTWSLTRIHLAMYMWNFSCLALVVHHINSFERSQIRAMSFHPKNWVCIHLHTPPKLETQFLILGVVNHVFDRRESQSYDYNELIFHGKFPRNLMSQGINSEPSHKNEQTEIQLKICVTGKSIPHTYVLKPKPLRKPIRGQSQHKYLKLYRSYGEKRVRNRWLKRPIVWDWNLLRKTNKKFDLGLLG